MSPCAHSSAVMQTVRQKTFIKKIINQPSSLPSWTAASPTPPLAPCTNNLSPFLALALQTLNIKDNVNPTGGALDCLSSMSEKKARNSSNTLFTYIRLGGSV